MAKTVTKTPAPKASHLSEDHSREFGEVHADAVQLMSALEFMDAQSDAIDRDGPEGVDARGGYASLVAILATTSKALVDRIESLELAIGRASRETVQ